MRAARRFGFRAGRPVAGDRTGTGRETHPERQGAGLGGQDMTFCAAEKRTDREWGTAAEPESGSGRRGGFFEWRVFGDGDPAGNGLSVSQGRAPRRVRIGWGAWCLGRGVPAGGSSVRSGRSSPDTGRERASARSITEAANIGRIGLPGRVWASLAAALVLLALGAAPAFGHGDHSDGTRGTGTHPHWGYINRTMECSTSDHCGLFFHGGPRSVTVRAMGGGDKIGPAFGTCDNGQPILRWSVKTDSASNVFIPMETQRCTAGVRHQSWHDAHRLSAHGYWAPSEFIPSYNTIQNPGTGNKWSVRAVVLNNSGNYVAARSSEQDFEIDGNGQVSVKTSVAYFSSSYIVEVTAKGRPHSNGDAEDRRLNGHCTGSGCSNDYTATKRFTVLNPDMLPKLRNLRVSRGTGDHEHTQFQLGWNWNSSIVHRDARVEISIRQRHRESGYITWSDPVRLLEVTAGENEDPDSCDTVPYYPGDLSIYSDYRIRARFSYRGHVGLWSDSIRFDACGMGGGGRGLRGELRGVPDEHKSPFTFEVHFDDDFSIGFATMRDHVFDVTNGRVTGARRLKLAKQPGMGNHRRRG